MTSPNLDSYPPLLRPTRNPDPEDSPSPTDDANTMAPAPDPTLDPVPLIDMECLEGSELERACWEWGIFRLVNHGVPARVLRELHGRAKSVFDLPFESKQGLGSPMKYFWGTPALTTSGVALPRATAAQNMDWVEGLNVPLSQLQSCHDHHHHPFIISFSKLLEDYGGHLTRLATTLFEAMGKNLKLDQLQLPKKTYLDESKGLVRVYRYPHRNKAEHTVKGMHVHTDSSILSILSEDEVGGLQFLKDEEWFDVKPIPNTLIVNLGDMMQALSDDKYKSVKHKVKLNNHKDRLSICYFVFPEENSLIQSSKYKPFTYNNFRAQVQHDVQTVGWKVGLKNFKLPQLT